jgi:TonB-dependent starch-binding outer membrane protein SusC
MKFSYLKILIFTFPFCFRVLTAQEAKHKIPTDSLKSDTLNDNTDEFLTGYTTQEQSRITGSVSFVKKQQLMTIPAGNVINQLQGFVPGLTVIGSGQPGETSKIFLRGIGSFYGNTPLFLVDGVPVDDISFLNPNDIESISVLKDAASGAIYGGRAMNGVLVIHTLKANKGIHVGYNTSMGFQLPGKGTADEMLNAQELADLQWLVYKNDNRTETHPLYGASTNPIPVLPSWAGNTDWYDALTEPALVQNHDLSVSAGTENAKIYIGAGYLDQNGIILNTDTKRYSARLNTEFTFFRKHFKIGENFQVANRSGRYVPNLTESSPILTGPYRSQSIIPVYITEPVNGLMHNFLPGEFGGTGMAVRTGNSSNAVADRIRNKDDNKTDQQLFGNAYMDIMIFKGLNWRTSYGSTWGKTESIDYTSSTYENAENLISSSNTEAFSKLSSWILTSFLNFKRTFGNHSMNLLAGTEWIKDHTGRSESMTRSGLVRGSGSLMNTYGYSFLPNTMKGVFLNADYSLKDKYFAKVSLRYDESNTERNTGNYYPAISFGWKISRERFMNGIQWVNDLKLRASYGKTGNIYYPGASNGFSSGLIGNSSDSDKDNIITSDLGLNSTFFNGHFRLVIDWFSRKSSDLYMIFELPGTSGSSGTSHLNIGKMKNSGIDAQLNFNQTLGNMKFNADWYFSRYTNKIGGDNNFLFEKAGSPLGQLVRNQQGHPISSFFGYQVAGLFSSQSEITGAPLQNGAQPGLFRYVNQNGDAVIDPKDRTFLGNANPDFTAGFNLGLSYKRFDLGVLLYWVQGNEILNFTKWWTDFWSSYNGQKSKRLLYEGWTENNRDASVPKATSTTSFSNNTQITSYLVENGSYLRMKNLQIGYNIGDRLLSRVKIPSLRIYLQAVNLFTITKYSGLDPEIGGDGSAFGIDNGNYPNARQVLIGLNLGIN